MGSKSVIETPRFSVVIESVVQAETVLETIWSRMLRVSSARVEASGAVKLTLGSWLDNT